MKKEVILEALKNAGVELDDEKTKEFVKAIQIANDEDITKARGNSAEKDDKIAGLQNELASYKAGGSNYIDITDYNNLKEFKKTIEEKEVKNKQKTSIEKLLDDNKFDTKVKALLTKAIFDDFKPTFDNDFKITNSDEVLNNLKANYKDFILTESVEGGTPQQNVNNVSQEDLFIKGFKGE